MPWCNATRTDKTIFEMHFYLLSEWWIPWLSLTHQRCWTDFFAMSTAEQVTSPTLSGPHGHQGVEKNKDLFLVLPRGLWWGLKALEYAEYARHKRQGTKGKADRPIVLWNLGNVKKVTYLLSFLYKLIHFIKDIPDRLCQSFLARP